MVLVTYEMKIQEDLVYDRTGTNIFGFAHLGEVNNDIQSLKEQLNNGTNDVTISIATHNADSDGQRNIHNVGMPIC